MILSKIFNTMYFNRPFGPVDVGSLGTTVTMSASVIGIFRSWRRPLKGSSWNGQRALNSYRIHILTVFLLEP